MKPACQRLRLPAVIPLIILFFIAPANLSAKSAAPCGCEDLPDLLNLLNQFNAALSAMEQIEKTTKPGEFTNEIVGDGKVSRRSTIDNGISRAIDSVTNNQAHQVKLNTTYSTCSATGEAETDCLKSLLEQFSTDSEK